MSDERYIYLIVDNEYKCNLISFTSMKKAENYLKKMNDDSYKIEKIRVL